MKKLKFLVRTIVICLIFGVLYLNVSERFETYSEVNQGLMKNFYKQDKNSIDALYIGSCHAYSTFIPHKLWDDYGVTSHVLASSGQEVQMSYYYLKEALKTQKPKVAVVEVYGVNKMDSYVSEDEFDKSVIFGFQSMRMSLDKIKYALDYDNISNSNLELLFGLYSGHDRWDYQSEAPMSELDFERFQKDYSFMANGWKEYWHVEENENESALLNYPQNDIIEDFDEVSEEYLIKIIELCKREGINLVLTSAPYDLKPIEVSRLNKVKEISESYNVPYINFNDEDIINKLDLHYYDMIDANHVDYSGAVKISDYVNKFIMDNYPIASKKGNQKYSSWDEGTKKVLSDNGKEHWYDDDAFREAKDDEDTNAQ